MTNVGTVERVLHADRLAIACRLLLGAVLLSITFLWVYFRDPSQVVLMTTVASVAICYIGWSLVPLLLTGKAIVITDRGLVDHTGGVNFVAWTEIRDARVRSYFGLKLVELDLPDAEPVLQRMSPVRRLFLRHYLKRYAGKPRLTGSFVQGGPEPLVALIHEKIRAARPAV